MWRNLLIQALHQVAVLLVLNFSSLTILGLKDDGDKAHAYKVKNSLIFNDFGMCQVSTNWKVEILGSIFSFIVKLRV
ncbi:calcium-transporting ATPase 9, plasma membrane-type-like [Hibiscus syriacus]|uniref:calcium-transporting ATPase 9, plasma membrane-type-like n=1 Tax=Hibiscus syriacus TaxID=106335 RepID=UPI001922F99A|nr:calcium-transporting ATPase 9, plasma membrane-type-like [Hibiscus syriacus]